MSARNPIYERYDNEAAKLRKKHGISYNEPVNPLDFAKTLEIIVIEANKISGLSKKDLAILKSIDDEWSGLSFLLPNNRKFVVLNPFHAQTRKNITLMEEICHQIYNHKPKMKVFMSGSEN